jgi:HlyD family secretion protein
MPATPEDRSTSQAKPTATLNATGTIMPRVLVDIGARVDSVVVAFGKDKDGKPIDFRSVVDEGTVLVRLDDRLYVIRAAKAQSQLDLANATLDKAMTQCTLAHVREQQAKDNMERAQKLAAADPAKDSSQYDIAKSAYGESTAQAATVGAAINVEKANVVAGETALEEAKWNVANCVIKSPVKGVVIDRRINVGQTVRAGLDSPSVFLIGDTRLQLWVQVNEADIALVKPGLAVKFTVDALPKKVFAGTVGKIRLNAAITKNVVNYTVEVDTDYSIGVLLPYMTANVVFDLR